MVMRHALDAAVATLLVAVAVPGCGRTNATSSDSPTSQVRLVDVDEGVRLEVIDWGGGSEGRPGGRSGRAVVLLVGSGNTAHVFDEFAPKLRDCCHVYAITRRGYGASSHPDTGYDDQRLADDVLAVLEQLHLAAPVLVGHSMGGGELTTLGSQHSDRLGGLVYLDALADPRDATYTDPAFMALLEGLPAVMRTPPSLEYSSIGAYRSAQRRESGFAFPESELREDFVVNPDGTMGRYKASTDAINRAIGAGQKKRNYTQIRVPVLAISTFTCTHDREGTDTCIEHPGDRPKYAPKSRDEEAAIEQYEVAQDVYFDRWKKNVRSAAAPVRLVDIPRGAHHIFLSHEADVLRELKTFVAGLR
jgi:pimeloyl-ACP methyl ester carboxylesterase